MAPLTRSRTGEARVPGPLNALYYRQRASAGLIIAEATTITPRGYGYPFTPGLMNQEQLDGWKLVTDAVHEEGGAIALQLWHVGRVSHPMYQPNQELPVSSSSKPFEGKTRNPSGDLVDLVPPRALERTEIPGILEDYARGTRMAREAGFDAVEIHGANGYLIEQFLYDGVNDRGDEYGGPIESRARLALEIVEACVSAWSPHRVGIRLSPNGRSMGVDDSNRSAVFSYLVPELDRRGVEFIHVIEGLPGTDRAPAPGLPALLPLIREKFSRTVIANGGYGRESAIEAVESGAVDMVAFGVPFISNPDLVERMKANVPLAPADRATFYAGGEKGYTDYPRHEPAIR